jgi:hypothetical protein
MYKKLTTFSKNKKLHFANIFWNFCSIFTTLNSHPWNFIFFQWEIQILGNNFSRLEFKKKSRITIVENLEKFRKRCKVEFFIFIKCWRTMCPHFSWKREGHPTRNFNKKLKPFLIKKLWCKICWFHWRGQDSERRYDSRSISIQFLYL